MTDRSERFESGRRFGRLRPVPAVALMVVAAMAVVGRARTNAAGLEAGGPWLVLAHVFDLAAVATLLALCWALGRRACARWPARGETPVEAVLFPVACGAGLIALMLFVLGAVGGHRPWTIVLIHVAAAAWTRRELSAINPPAALGDAG